MSHPASGVTVRVQSLVVAFAMAFAFAGSAMAQMSDVIISQYVESGGGSSNADAIELYNGTNAAIDLGAGGYKLQRYDNGSTTPSETLTLSGLLPSRGTRVYVNSANTISALNNLANVRSSRIAFTGDDAIVLVKGSSNTVVDSFGDVGDNPIGGWGSGSTDTQGNSLIRKPSIKAGRTAISSTFTPSDQWQADSAGYLNSLGEHTAYYSYGLPASTLAASANPSSNGWVLNQYGCTGEFRGNSGGNGYLLSSGAGAGANAWGIWSSNGLLCSDDSSIWATQMLDGALQTGQSVSIDFDHGTIRTGKYVAVEFLYVNSEGLTNGLAAQVYFVGGDSYYKLADSTTRTTTIPYSSDGGTVKLRITGTGTYSLSYRGVTYTGTLGASAPTVNAVRIVNKAANDEYRYNGDEGNVFFNNLAVGCIDVDNDGACAGTDCNDSNAAIYLGAPELCANAGTDNDCDGNASEVDANAADRNTYYADADGDTYGNAAASQLACSAPAGYVANSTDCNDASAAVKPSAAELCATAGTDNDCDGDSAEIDANASDKVSYYVDADGDNYTTAVSAQFCPGTTNAGYRSARSASVDCNDANVAIKPGATDVCDGVDNNCDGTIDPSSCASITPPGNGGASFAGSSSSGAIGGSTLDVNFSGANVVFTITKGAAPFGDALVLYIDSASGGFASTSGFTDTGDASRKAISGYNGSTRSTVNFPSGFTANYALYISPATNVYAGAWSLANGGAHTHIGAATMSPTNDANAATYTVTIPRSYLGILPGQQFKFVGTYLNPLTAVRSNEGYGEGLPASGNVSGAATFTTWLTATAPCTSSETLTAPFDGTTGTAFSNVANGTIQWAPCGTGTPSRLFLVRDGQSSVYGNWRGPAIDGLIDSFSASFQFSFKNGGGRTGDGFAFYWGDASNLSGTRYEGGEGGLRAFWNDGAGLQVGFKGYTGSGTTGVTAYWGNQTLLGSTYAQNFDAINYSNNDACYASDASRMATATVTWTRGQGVTVTLQMPGASSATTTHSNVGSATLANINPMNWHFGFVGRNGSIDQDVIIGNFTVTATRTGATYYVDMDGDGSGATGSNLDACQSAIPAGYTATSGDCDDTNSAVKPGATEVCDGIDNNCVAGVDEGLAPVTYYRDSDNDTYGNPLSTAVGCQGSVPTGYVANSTDCDDANAAAYPGAAELCATVGTDNNCDSNLNDVDSNAGDRLTAYRDADGDGVSVNTTTTYCSGSLPSGYVAALSNPVDCNDTAGTGAAIYPGAVENCANLGVDNDCDSVNDDAEAIDVASYYVDGDVDGFGAGAATLSCSAISGSVTNGTDCDDAQPTKYPGAAELCSTVGEDNNCNSDANDIDANAADKLTAYRDADGDGYSVNTTVRYCTGSMPTGYLTTLSSPADCDDTVGTGAASYPGAVEDCANLGVDNDCDGANDAAEAVDSLSYYVDGDTDGYGAGAATKSCSAIAGSVTNNTDCDDTTSTIRPGAVENCANLAIDNDCDGDTSANEAVDSTSYYVDGDHDTYGAGSATKSCSAVSGSVTNNTDCDDAKPAVYPGAAELCATVGTDNNCDSNVNDVDAGAADKVAYYRDADNDGYSVNTTANFCSGTTNAGYLAALSSPVDCDDTSAQVRPGAAENCANIAVDNDCDGDTSADEASDSASYYVDGDTDGFGAGAATKSCSAISGSVTNNTDCNDSNAAIKPTATEVCDSGNVDENCSGGADNNDSGATGKTAFYADNDGDGFGAGNANQRCDAVGNEVGNDGDCDDADATRSPLTVWYPDADQDGRGVLAGAVTQCTRPGAQFARAVGDLCPNDALKTDPGTCGCGTVDADTNGNGVPDCSDNTPPAVRLALLTEDANIGSGEKLYVTVALQSGPIQGVGAQVVLAYDRTKLSLDTNFGSGGTFYEIAEGSPLDIPLFAQHDGTAGKLIVALGMGVGNSDLAVGGALLKLRFTCIGDYAGAANAVTFTTWNTFQSSVGNAASQSVGVGAPANLPPVSSTPGRVVLSAVPAPVALWADADGSGSAAVTIVPPTAVDASSQAVNVTWTRSDSGSNLTTFPSGVTTITWSATDSTGNTSTATTQVNVSADSVMMADVALGGNYSASAFTRGIQVAARKGSATDTDANTVVLNQSSSGGNYRAEGRVRLAVAGGTDWTTGCAAVRDPLHTLRRALAVAKTTVAGSMGGRSYNSAYVVDGTDPTDYLLSGNVDGNAVIDILDYGTFVNQRGVLLPINTYAGAAMPHTDLNGNGQVTLADLTFIQANIFKQDEQCTAAAGETPIRKITVRELRRLGLGDMAAADMNGDGVLDATDLALAMQGADRTEDAGTPDAEQPAGSAQE